MSLDAKINSFRSVKSRNHDFKAFQDTFLARVGGDTPIRSFKESSHLVFENFPFKENLVDEKPLNNDFLTLNRIDYPANKLSSSQLRIYANVKTSDNIRIPKAISRKAETIDENLTIDRKNVEDSLAASPAYNWKTDRRSQNNKDLLEFHLKKEDSTVIPFVKKFLNKLKNASSLRNLQQLKASNFNLLADSAYFFQDQLQKKRVTNLPGWNKFGLRIRSLYELQIYKLKQSLLFKKVKNLIKFKKIMVIHPYQNIKILWDSLHLLVILFWLFYIPIFMAFEEVQNFELSVNSYTTFFLLIDIFFNFNTAYFKNGVVESNHKKIFLHYLKRRFFLDFVPMIPMGLEMILDGIGEKRISLKWMKFLFYVKIISLKEIFLRMNEKFLLKEKFQNILSLFKVLFISVLVSHLFACFWYYTSQASHSNYTWISHAGLINSPWHIKYLYSLYWACVTMMTVGYGDITPQNNVEIIVCMISVLLGCAVYAYNISSIGMILQDINKENVDFDRKINIINQFMTRKRINQDLQMRIREYLRFIWQEENTQNLEDEQKIICLLSNSLKEELLIEAYGSILRKFPMFFANFTETSLRKVVTIMKDIKLFPEEIVFNENDEDNLSIYFIMKGKVELCTESGLKVKELGVGDNFGELGFFSGKSRTLTAKSKDFTTLFSINRQEFIDVLMKNQDDYEKFCMIQDQILLYGNYLPLKIRCISCNQLGHIAHQCQSIHFIPDREKIIKRYNYYVDQERTMNYIRKGQKYKALLKKGLLTEANHKIIQETAHDRTNLQSEELMSLCSSELSLVDDEENEFEDVESSPEFVNQPKDEKENPSINFGPKENENKAEENMHSGVNGGDEEEVLTNYINSFNNLQKMSSKVMELIAVNTSSMRKTETILTSNIHGYNTLLIPSGEIIEEFKGFDHKNTVEGSMVKFNDKNNLKKKFGPCLMEVGKDEIGDRKEKNEKEEGFENVKSEIMEQAKFRRKRRAETKKHHTNSTKKHDSKEFEKISNNESYNKKGYNSTSWLEDFRKMNLSVIKDRIEKQINIKKTSQTNNQNYSVISNSQNQGSKISKMSSSQIDKGTLKELTETVFNERILDNFDRVTYFKNYFPENNSKTILEQINSKKINYRYSKLKDRKSNLEKRLAKYTFFPEEMKHHMPGAVKQRMRMRSLDKKRKGILEDPIGESSKSIKKFGRKLKKKYFTQGLIEQKFSDIVQIIMMSPVLRKKLKKKRETLV